jgi:hypothetical protein
VLQVLLVALAALAERLLLNWLLHAMSACCC